MPALLCMFIIVAGSSMKGATVILTNKIQFETIALILKSKQSSNKLKEY